MASTEEIRVARLVSGIDDAIAACRAWGHEWPSRKLRPGRKLPRGFTPRLLRDGYVEITESCLNGCGKKRRRLTLPGGVYDHASRLSYVNPASWQVIPADERITPRDFQAEVFRRVNEELMTAAKQNPEGADEPENATPLIRFSEGSSA